MNRKQFVAIGVLPVLTVTMIAIYRLLARLLGPKRAWYAGFWVYWPIWCIFFPLRMVGLKKVLALFSDRRPNVLGWFMLIFPPVIAFLGRFALDKQPREAKEKIVLGFMSVINGTLEEVLWRGVYVELFPNKPLWGVVWPTVWFALWHYAPGSVSPLTNVWALMTGAGVFGACLSWLAMQTRSIRWSVASHILSGLVQALS